MEEAERKPRAPDYKGQDMKENIIITLWINDGYASLNYGGKKYRLPLYKGQQKPIVEDV